MCAFGSAPASSSRIDSGTPVHSAQDTRPCSAWSGAWIGSGENIGALLPPHSTKCLRVTIGYRIRSSTVNSSGCLTMPWMTSRCCAGSMSGMPECRIVKCSGFGVMVPLSICNGARACWVRGSPFGLLSVRTTAASNRDGFCSTGVTSPGDRLQSGSVSGSAAAPVSAAPLPSAPANIAPPPSSARRCSKPLPATGSSGGAPPLPLRIPMRSSCRSARYGAGRMSHMLGAA